MYEIGTPSVGLASAGYTTRAGEGPGLALLLDHDDREREFAYESVSGTLKEREPITGVATRLGWTVIAMAKDWPTVLAG